jgi:hypothetical protein
MVNSCITLTTTKKNQLSVSDYYAKMSHFDNELAASDNPLHDDELFAYLLASLDKDFNLVFTAMVARVDPITLSGLYAQFLSFEHHTNLHAHNSWGGGGGGIIGHGYVSWSRFLWWSGVWRFNPWLCPWPWVRSRPLWRLLQPVHQVDWHQQRLLIASLVPVVLEDRSLWQDLLVQGGLLYRAV